MTKDTNVTLKAINKIHSILYNAVLENMSNTDKERLLEQNKNALHLTLSEPSDRTEALMYSYILLNKYKDIDVITQFENRKNTLDKLLDKIYNLVTNYIAHGKVDVEISVVNTILYYLGMIAATIETSLSNVPEIENEKD